MRNQITIPEVTDCILKIETAGVEYRTVNTAVICNNMLITAGIEQLLEGTPFICTVTLANVPETTDNCYLSIADFIIIKDSFSAEHTVEAIKRLKESYPGARIAVLADSYGLSFVQFCLSAGVTGFCDMESSREALIKSFELVMLGELILPAALMASLLNGVEPVITPMPQGARVDRMMSTEDPRGKKISAREAEILRHLMEGSANKVIARKLDVAEATIKVHIKSILRKVGAANRTQAAMWASTSLPRKNAVPLSRDAG